MPTTLAVRFPLGRYHATAWDRSVNEGAVEWPPSPWRLLRALIATRHHRWPELPDNDLDRLLVALSAPPAYRTPPSLPAHTRHYLPDAGVTSGERAGTDLTLDPFLWLPRDDDLLMQWPVDLAPHDRATLAKLADLLPYLGRADAVCYARLLEQDPAIDAGWWRPAEGGPVRLLGVEPPARRSILEVTTVHVRSSRRTEPPGTTWISYRAPDQVVPAPRTPPAERTVEAVRFAVQTRFPLRIENAVLLTDAMHYRLGSTALDQVRILGQAGAPTDHQHAHCIPIADRRGVIAALVLWVPARLTAAEVATVIGAAGAPLSARAYPGSEPIRGFPAATLLLQAAGHVQDVAPELCGPATRWGSVTPYLPVRHRKRRVGRDEFLADDVTRELAHRGIDTPVTLSTDEPGEQLTDRWALGFRRYRLRQHMGEAHVGLGLQLAFDRPIEGPLLLGRLSHFGFGCFVPLP